MIFSVLKNLFMPEQDYYLFKRPSETAEDGEYLIERKPRQNFIRVSRKDGSHKTLPVNKSMGFKLALMGIPMRHQDKILNQVWNFGSARVRVKSSATWGKLGDDHQQKGPPS